MGKKVLVIDDDVEMGMLIEMVLEADGHDVHIANSGSGGLELASEVHPDLVILDIMMPDMDGFAVCSSLREMLNVPVLMLTAHSSEKQMLRSFTTGADDFLGKPFGNAELRARVRALLRRSEY
ncbi:MAG: response regulator [Chloroflexi bacterium]|nr:response regulator [Chloroflexota bacterium]